MSVNIDVNLDLGGLISSLIRQNLPNHQIRYHAERQFPTAVISESHISKTRSTMREFGEDVLTSAAANKQWKLENPKENLKRRIEIIDRKREQLLREIEELENASNS